MERIQEARTLSSKKINVDEALTLITFCKDLMTHLRTIWTPPPEGTYYFVPHSWIEEMLLICYRISECLISNSKTFMEHNIMSQFSAIMVFAAAQLHQIDVLAPVINHIIQYLTFPNMVIPLFVQTQNRLAVSLLLDAYLPQLSSATIMTAVLSLCTDPQYEFQIRPLIDKLEDKYPEQIASIRAFIIIRNAPQSEKISKCDSALRILNTILETHPNSAQILYNLAYISAIKNDKEVAFSFVQRSLSINPNDPRALLLFLRILRSNCQYDQALKVIDAIKHVLDHPDKFLTAEAMFIAAESGDLNRTESLFQKLQRHWPNDPFAMNVAVRINLLLGKPQSAADCFAHWAEYDKQSPEFFFCFAQLCLASRDYSEAERFLLYAVELAPTYGEYHAALATVFFKNGKKEKAKDRAKFAVQVDPLSMHAWIALALVTSGAESADASERAAELRRSSVDLKCINLILFPSDVREHQLPHTLL